MRNRISGANFYIVFYSLYGSVLLSFRGMATGRTTDGRTDGPTLASIAYAADKAGQQNTLVRWHWIMVWRQA